MLPYIAYMDPMEWGFRFQLGVSENSVPLLPLDPMVLLIIIPMKNGYFIGNIPKIFRQTQFSPNPRISPLISPRRVAPSLPPAALVEAAPPERPERVRVRAATGRPRRGWPADVTR